MASLGSLIFEIAADVARLQSDMGKAICQKVLIIHRGKIVADDTMAALTGGKETGLEDKFIQLTAE